MKLSVVIPVYNEAPGLTRTLARFERTIAGCAAVTQFEVLVIDDGSTDGAFQNVRLPAFARLLTHPTNRGYGASLKTGIRAAVHPVIAICDADGSYAVEALPALLALYSEPALIVAARQSIPYPHLGAVKRVARAAFTFWLWSLTGCWIRDINSGLRLIARERIAPLLDLLSDRFSFTTGTTIQWILAGQPIIYLSTPYAKRWGESKVNFIRDGAGVINQVLRMVFKRHPVRTLFVLLVEGLVLAGALVALFLLKGKFAT